jgi:hypothetical protein
MAQPQISQVNPNVPSTAQVPDTYLYISTVPTTITTAQPKNLFLVATAILAASQILNAPYSLTAGTAVANEIAQYSDVTRVNLAFNRRSPIANRFRNAIQEIPIGINIFCASIMEPSNSGFAGFATKLLTFAGTAQGSGEITIRACGHECRVPVANGDTAAVIATDAKTTLDRYIPDAPMVTAGIIASTTVPLTYVVRGEDGNDSPVLVYIPPEITGITVSPGTITVTTNAIGNSAASSLFTLQCDSTTYPATIPVGTTPTQAAALIAASINGTAGPLAATSALGVVTLIYRSGWYVKKLQMSSTEDATGQVYTLADRHNSAGAITNVATVPGSTTLTGLSGAGDPTLTTLLANKAKQPAFQEWAVDYLDATSTSALYAHIEQYGNGYYQQNQRVTFVSTDPLEVAKTVATNATPNLGLSWRYSVGVYQGAACQGGAYAAQTAARLCATDLPFNMDGQILQVGTIAPMLPGRAETDLAPPSQDVALGSYHLFPFVGENGAVRIVRGKTVWTQSNTEWGDWSYGRLFDLIRFQLRTFLNARFKQKVQFFGGGVIRVPNGFRALDVKNAIGEYLDAVDGILIDGASRLKNLIAVEPDSTNLGTLRIYLQVAVPRELHILSGVIGSI